MPVEDPARRPRPLVVASAVVILIALSASSCADEPSGVSLGEAGRGTVAEIVEAPASVTARAAATVTAPAAGTLAELRVEPGDRVGRGQVLAVIAAPELERRRENAQHALDEAARGSAQGAQGASGGTAGFTAVRRRTDRQATTAFAEARAAAGRISDPALRQALLKQIEAAEGQYSAASAAAADALHAVERGVTSLGRAIGSLSAAQRLQAQQAYDLADAAVEALTLRAPVAGVVQLGGTATGGGGVPSPADLIAGAPLGQQPVAGVDASVPQGGHVAAGTPVATVVDVTRLGLAAEVDETDVLLVEPGTEATVELDAATGTRYRAKVRSIDLLPTTSARGGVSYKVRLDLDKSDDPAPRPGMSAIIRLEVRRAVDAVTVPASAVVADGGRDTVWTVRNGRYERVPVTVGVQGEDIVQITAGLTAGQRVVVAGTDRVRAGDEPS